MLDIAATRFSLSSGLQTQEATTARPASCLIRIYPAEGIGEMLKLGERRVVIGRDESCELVLGDDSVSRRHALLEPVPHGYVLTDLGSTNGTYVNDERIEHRRLEPGDRLRFGHQIIKFLSTDSLEAAYHDTVYQIMTTDGLTHAHNKRYFLEFVEREFQRAGRTGRPLSLLMLDADHFKRVNDTYGHLAGDEVLIELCRRVREILRRDELLARYGGEEFALVMTDTTPAEAVEVGERIRAAVAAREFVTEQASFAVTVSIGVASTDGLDCAQPEDLIERADQRLYAAKQAGRNRVMS